MITLDWISTSALLTWRSGSLAGMLLSGSRRNAREEAAVWNGEWDGDTPAFIRGRIVLLSLWADDATHARARAHACMCACPTYLSLLGCNNALICHRQWCTCGWFGCVCFSATCDWFYGGSWGNTTQTLRSNCRHRSQMLRGSGLRSKHAAGSTRSTRSPAPSLWLVEPREKEEEKSHQSVKCSSLPSDWPGQEWLSFKR